MEASAIVEKLRPYLSKSLTKAEVYKLQALRMELAEAVVDARQSLLEKRRQVLWPKDKDMTELDRKTRQDGDTAVYERDYLFLMELQEITRDQINLFKA